ncbi:phosphotransferase [Candidatus Entotheonella palauensis]|nr:phosphotransferase [Candidatus Entotheonella palauensis]
MMVKLLRNSNASERQGTTIVYPDKSAGEALNETTVGDQLLAALRQRMGDASLEFSEPPTRITGGFETLTYGFRLSAVSGDFAGPLVLRLFNQTDAADQGRREEAVQNALAALGYPVPRVVGQFDAGINGRSFNVIKRIAGHAMTAEVGLTEEASVKVTTWLAKLHSQLHRIPSGPVIEAVEKAGFPRERFSMEARFRYMSRYFEDHALDGLKPAFDWLVRNKPAEQRRSVVCHGDFHPGNVMIEDGNVTGVIDWSAAAFADPEMDVAATLTVIKVAAGELEPKLRPFLDTMAALYLKVYQESTPIDPDKVLYYEAFRCFRTFTRATALHTPGLPPSLVPHDQYPWSGEFAMQMARAQVKEVTGIEMPMTS